MIVDTFDTSIFEVAIGCCMANPLTSFALYRVLSLEFLSLDHLVEDDSYAAKFGCIAVWRKLDQKNRKRPFISDGSFGLVNLVNCRSPPQNFSSSSFTSCTSNELFKPFKR